MESENIIKINSKVELVVNLGTRVLTGMFEVKGFTTNSVMLAITEEDKEILEFLSVKTPIVLNVYSYTGVIILTSKVKETVKEDVIVIDFPTEKKRVQRRQFFRVGLQRPIQIICNDGHKAHDIKGKTVDLSGGGVRFWSQEKPPVGFIAVLKMGIQDYCGSGQPVEAKGRILYSRIHDSRFTSHTGYISVAQFGEMDQRTSQFVMQTCFKVQIEMRKKGIL